MRTPTALWFRSRAAVSARYPQLIYNAVVFAGLKTTERHAHTYEPSYVTPGEDAMVSYDGYAGPDLRFVNNGKTAIGIKASISVRP